MKPIFFLLLFNSFLFSQSPSLLPKEIKERLCKTLEQSDSATNSCQNGSTIQYRSHLITNNDNIVLFVYLDEHLATPPIYPPVEVALLVDKQGNWIYRENYSYNYLKKIPKVTSENWKITKTKDSISFRHKLTKKIIKLANTTEGSEVFYLQIGAYKHRNYRRVVQRRLARLPYPPHLATRKVGYETYSKLLIGPFSTLEKTKFVKKMLPRRHRDAFIFHEISKG